MRIITHKLALALTAALLKIRCDSYGQVTNYDNMSTPVTAGYAELNSANPIFGDSLSLAQGGLLSTFGVSLYNPGAGDNTGRILAGTMLIKFYDNTPSYTGGINNRPLLGTANISWDFASAGGLPAGFFTTGFFNLTAYKINLTSNILVTQQFTLTAGDSVGNGVALLSDPVVGASPNTFYINSTSSREGLYMFTGNPGQPGYQVQLAAPVFNSMTRTGGTLHLSWSSYFGRSYQLQYKTNLNASSWSNLGSPIVANGPTTSTSDTMSSPGYRFYRVMLLPVSVPPPSTSIVEAVTNGSSVRSDMPAIPPDESSTALPPGSIRPTIVLPFSRLENNPGRLQEFGGSN
jgi:hypothetical protein